MAFICGNDQGGGGGTGGGVAVNAGVFEVGRTGRTATNTNLRITGLSITMTIGGRGMVVKTKFSISDFQYWGNTNDGTNIGVEFRVVRHSSGSPVTIYNQTVDLPSTIASTNQGYFGSLPTPIQFEPDDIFYATIRNSTSGGTAADVTNPMFQFEVIA
jgi:hypothetical protein